MKIKRKSRGQEKAFIVIQLRETIKEIEIGGYNNRVITTYYCFCLIFHFVELTLLMRHFKMILVHMKVKHENRLKLLNFASG